MSFFWKNYKSSKVSAFSFWGVIKLLPHMLFFSSILFQVAKSECRPLSNSKSKWLENKRTSSHLFISPLMSDAPQYIDRFERRQTVPNGLSRGMYHFHGTGLYSILLPFPFPYSCVLGFCIITTYCLCEILSNVSAWSCRGITN